MFQVIILFRLDKKYGRHKKETCGSPEREWQGKLVVRLETKLKRRDGAAAAHTQRIRGAGSLQAREEGREEPQEFRPFLPSSFKTSSVPFCFVSATEMQHQKEL